MGQNQGMDVPVEGSGDVWRCYERKQTHILGAVPAVQNVRHLLKAPASEL